MNLRVIKGWLLIAAGAVVVISDFGSGVDAIHTGLSKFTPAGRDSAKGLLLLLIGVAIAAYGFFEVVLGRAKSSSD